MSELGATTSPTKWVADQAKLYEESGGTKGLTVQGSPCLLIDTLGRKSGQWRRSVLIYGRDGEDYLVVASLGGSDHHPLWYLNLTANPQVRLRVETERFAATAETLSPRRRRGCGRTWWRCSRPTRATSRRPSGTSRWSDCDAPPTRRRPGPVARSPVARSRGRVREFGRVRPFWRVAVGG